MEKYLEMISKKYCEVFCKTTVVCSGKLTNYSENIAERFTAKLLKSVLQKYSEVLCKNIERRFAKLLRGVLYSPQQK